jgi:hypothetical protein
MNLVDRFVGLWQSEPAIIRGFLAGILGIVALFVEVPNDLLDNIINIIGFVVLLGDGLWVRRAVTPVEGK